MRFMLIGTVLSLGGTISSTAAQQVRISLRLPSDSAARALVEGNFAPRTEWSFPDSYAGIVGLGARIGRFQAFGPDGKEIQSRKIAPGQFSASAPAAKFTYEVILSPPARATDSAKVSWVNSERGLLMLRDLLPAFGSHIKTNSDRGGAANKAERVSVRFDLPNGWVVYSNEKQIAANEFQINDADEAVFAIGNHLRSSRRTISGLNLNLVTDGQWAFADNDAVELAAKVLKADRDLFGSAPFTQTTLILYPYPQQVAADKWSAETRGSTVTLLMGNVPSKVGALAQLSTPLTHELFHLWVPNGLALDGDYDWFYEGFTVYEAARTAVRLELLTFPEFLNAIGRAYDGYLAGTDRDRWSLIEASKRRWTVGQPSVYSKSMVIAFLYDLKMRTQSRRKRSLDDVYRKIFQGYSLLNNEKTGQGWDGNDAATSVLAFDDSMQAFVRAFISNPVTINLQQELAPFSLRVETFGLRTRVSVNEQLSKQQRDLLRDLGYNDITRGPRRSSQKN